MLRSEFSDVSIDYYQSNVEGEIIDKIHEVGFSFDYILINAGAIRILQLQFQMLLLQLKHLVLRFIFLNL